MGGSDSSFGSVGGAPVPADPTDEEQGSPMTHDGGDELAGFDEPGDTFSPSSDSPRSDRDEIPRHTKPFRAWGAAQESRDQTPSLWARFRSWLAKLFRRAEPESQTELELQADADPFGDEAQSDHDHPMAEILDSDALAAPVATVDDEDVSASAATALDPATDDDAPTARHEAPSSADFE